MAFTISKFNRTKLFDFTAPEGFEYKSLEQAKEIKDVFPVRAVYINTKSKFGDAPVMATDDFFINLPKHQLESVKSIMADSEAVHAINAGFVAIQIYDYEKDGKTYQGVNWKDVDEQGNIID